MDTLTGKVAIITGGASGIGKAVAEVLAEANLSGLTIADIDGKAAEEVATEICRRFDTEAIGVATDVAVAAQVEAMCTLTVELQRMDILVNNTGIAPVVPWADVTKPTGGTCWISI